MALALALDRILLLTEPANHPYFYLTPIPPRNLFTTTFNNALLALYFYYRSSVVNYAAVKVSARGFQLTTRSPPISSTIFILGSSLVRSIKY